jgi:8-oxo-dGTP pyrophosphatase MutT (NUDIX family)
MPIPEHVQRLRSKVGHELIFLPGVCALVINDASEILLGRRSDTGEWAVIGGILDPGEALADAVVREVLEETGIHAVPERITGVYTTPVITYPNGDRAQYVITAFRCRYLSGMPYAADEESLEVRFFPLNALPELRPDHLPRIEHAMADAPAYFAPPSGRG